MTPPGRKIVAAHLADHEDDENRGLKGYVKATDYALPYMSQWSRINDEDVKSELLRHINCGYLSTHGIPPTLLALKQHAQSLCALIQILQPDVKVGEVSVDGATKGEGKASGSSAAAGTADDNLAMKFELNSAFDFLNDLRTPYHNDDIYHHKPLVSLINEVRGRNEVYGTDYHCPLTEIQHYSPPTKPTGSSSGQEDSGVREFKPYSNLQNLLNHTNACLERLDHEYTATGGLLSVLPTDAAHDTTELAHARTTLLGQWLLFTQHLVARMHELERSYGNALDVLAGEAAIPHQVLSKLGPDGRSGRAIAYPQDQYILVNAGEDVYEYIHSLLDKREAVVQAKEKVWRKNGVVGEEMWHKNPQTGSSSLAADDGTGTGLYEEMEKVDGDLVGAYFSRGIVQVDVTTRYYRLANSGKSVLFVIPAHSVHPGVEHTRVLEQQPTIMATVQPRYPPRASELEMKYNKKIRDANKIQQENLDLQNEMGSQKEQIRTLKAEVDRLTAARDALMHGIGMDEALAKQEAEINRKRAERAERMVKQLTGEGGKKTSKKGRRLGDFEDEDDDEEMIDWVPRP